MYVHGMYATPQVLGITNYSHWRDGKDMRVCTHSDDVTRMHMVETAKARLSKFVHVGTTERLAQSAATAGVGVHAWEAGAEVWYGVV